MFVCLHKHPSARQGELRIVAFEWWLEEIDANPRRVQQKKTMPTRPNCLAGQYVIRATHYLEVVSLKTRRPQGVCRNCLLHKHRGSGIILPITHDEHERSLLDVDPVPNHPLCRPSSFPTHSGATFEAIDFVGYHDIFGINYPSGRLCRTCITHATGDTARCEDIGTSRLQSLLRARYVERLCALDTSTDL